MIHIEIRFPMNMASTKPRKNVTFFLKWGLHWSNLKPMFYPLRLQNAGIPHILYLTADFLSQNLCNRHKLIVSNVTPLKLAFVSFEECYSKNTYIYNCCNTTQISSICPHHVETQHKRRRPVSQEMVRPWGLSKSDFLDTPHSTVAAIGPSTLPSTHPALCGILYLEFQIPHPVFCILSYVFWILNSVFCTLNSVFKIYVQHNTSNELFCSRNEPLRVDLSYKKNKYQHSNIYLTCNNLLPSSVEVLQHLVGEQDASLGQPDVRVDGAWLPAPTRPQQGCRRPFFKWEFSKKNLVMVFLWPFWRNGNQMGTKLGLQRWKMRILGLKNWNIHVIFTFS